MLLNRARIAAFSARRFSPGILSQRCPTRIAAPGKVFSPVHHFGSSSVAPDGEKQITDILREKLAPTYIQVRDISGGCGSMFEIVIDSEQFKGKRLLQQHRMINEALGEEVISSLHGLTIKIENPQTKS